MRVRSFPGRVVAAVPVPLLLLFYLLQSGGWRWLCHQPRRDLRNARDRGRRERLGVPGADRRRARSQPGAVALLQRVRDRTLGLQSIMAGAGPPFRLGCGHPTPGALRESTNDAELRCQLGRDLRCHRRAPLPRVPGRIFGRLAPSSWPARQARERLKTF